MGWVSKKVAKSIERSKETDTYWVEKAKFDFAVELDRVRKVADIKSKKLAEKLGTSAAYISRVFRGDTNLTIESMVKLARATGANVEIRIVTYNVANQPQPVTDVTNNVIAMPQAFLGRISSCPPSANAGAWIKNLNFDDKNILGKEAA
jgi:transcriptional regulator with XRE-family HTH domain